MDKQDLDSKHSDSKSTGAAQAVSIERVGDIYIAVCSANGRTLIAEDASAQRLQDFCNCWIKSGGVKCRVESEDE